MFASHHDVVTSMGAAAGSGTAGGPVGNPGASGNTASGTGAGYTLSALINATVLVASGTGHAFHARPAPHKGIVGAAHAPLGGLGAVDALRDTVVVAQQVRGGVSVGHRVLGELEVDDDLRDVVGVKSE